MQTIQNINTGSVSNWQTIITDTLALDTGNNSLSIATNSNFLINSVRLVPASNNSASITGINVGESTAFTLRDDPTWTHVIPLNFLSYVSSSQGAQTLSINITELTPDGAGYIVIRTNANGFWYSTNRQELALGNNIITVPAESFERHVRLQFSNPNIKFDSLSVNEIQLYPEVTSSEPHQEELTVGESSAFSIGPNETWTNVIALALASEGESSQAAQTLTINITELPTGGANYRVFKTTANGNNYFGNAHTWTQYHHCCSG